MRGELFYDDFAAPWPEQRRLAVCMALSTGIVLLVLSLVEWPAPGALARLIPPVLKVKLEHAAAEGERGKPGSAAPPPARAAAAEADAAAGQPSGPAVAQPEQMSSPSRAAEKVAAAAVPQDARQPHVIQQPATRAAENAAGASGSGAASISVDWYTELTRVAAEVGARAAAQPQSMHPEFDELRRVAKLRYGEARTNPPPPSWEVVKDPYGRKLLKNGPFFKVLDDLRLFNQYAFEHFERHMLFVSIPLGRPKPKNLPWVETIRARYAYFLEPDELPPLKATPTEQSPDP